MNDTTCQDRMVALLTDYADAWRENSPEALEAFWSARDFFAYKAEEVPEVLRRWPDVRAYWEHNARLHEAIVLDLSDVHAVQIAPGHIIGTARMRWDIRFAEDARTADGAAFPHRGLAMGGDNHIVALAVDTEAGLRLTGWIEAPDAPLSYMRSLYLGNANEDLV